MLIYKDPKTMKPTNIDINWFKVEHNPLHKEEYEDLNSFIFNERLPFDDVGLLYNGEKSIFLLQTIDEDTMEFGSINEGLYVELALVIKDHKRNQMAIKTLHEKLSEQDAKNIFGVVANFFKGLQKGYSQVFKPVGHKSNPKRIKKGKKPIYEWKLIDIKPKSSRVCLGGTHSSPRQHQRRGHWRLIKKTGNKVWVKSCTVGSAENGVINHVYRL